MHVNVLLQDIGIERVTTHDDYYYDGKVQSHDIALIRLKRAIDFNSKYQLT